MQIGDKNIQKSKKRNVSECFDSFRSLKVDKSK